MKKQVFIYLMFVSSVITGRENDTTFANIPHHASIIYVKNVSFTAIVDQLMKDGYKTDVLVENVIVTTKYKVLAHSSDRIKFFVRYSDGTAQVMARLENILFTKKNRTMVRYKHFAFTESFWTMNNFALSLNGIVSYEK